MELLRRTIAADPTFLPAQVDYLALMANSATRDAPVDLSFLGGDAPFRDCLTAIVESPIGYPQGSVKTLLEQQQMGEGNACTALYLAGRLGRLTPAQAWVERENASIAEALRHVPEFHAVWNIHVAALRRAGLLDEAEMALADGIAHQQHPWGRVPLYLRLAEVRLERGDTNGAESLVSAVEAAVERDGRPGIRWVYLKNLADFFSGANRIDEFEAAHAEAAVLTRSHGAWYWEHYSLYNLGLRLTGAGRPQAALEYFPRAASIADSVGWPILQLQTYLKWGRAYAQTGELAEAERKLKAAIEHGQRAPAPYWLADAYHNLAHVYESEGRLADASRAVDRFIELARPLRHSQARLMALRDAGMIRWKAGWHAAANAAFAEMVEVIEEQQHYFHWAGEHLERVGDLTGALSYYRRGAESDESERGLNLAGMARVYEALGHADSAEAAARAHDREPTAPFDTPLLPEMLARRGRFAEAVQLAHAWADSQEVRRNLRGTTLAHVGLADLLLRWGKARAAVGEAERAGALAGEFNFVDELIESHRLAGLGLISLGMSGSGLEQLREAEKLADSHPTVASVVSTHLSLAESLGQLGQAGEALAAYQRAAEAIEAVTSMIGVDTDRTRYRAQHLAPYDGAIRLLLNQGRTADVRAQLLAWSQRRKAHALALANGITPGDDQRIPSSLRLEAIMASLRAGEALIDYTLVDSAVALVATRDTAALIRLPLSVAEVETLVDRLRRPLTASYAGHVDLARAVFDLDAAKALHDGVLRPVEPLLGEVDRLLIVPDGPLYYLPFDALVSQAEPSLSGEQVDYTAARYAIDRYAIIQLPSLQFLRLSDRRDRIDPRGQLVAFLVDAPGAVQEVEAIREAWSPGSLTLLVGAEATETAMQKARTTFTLVHFAGHALADGVDPLASHLRLTPDQWNDGYLHLLEIAEQPGRAELVVLSGCETAGARLFAGEGLMGLARAFLAGGARSVVATRWPIGPSAADVMGAFYRELAAGRPPAAALRAAQLELRHYPARAHPFYWASFFFVQGS